MNGGHVKLFSNVHVGAASNEGNSSIIPIRNEGTGILYLTGTASVNKIYLAHANTLIADNGAFQSPIAYTGTTKVNVICGWDISSNENAVIVKNASLDRFTVTHDLIGSKYVVQEKDGNIGIAKIAYGSWAYIGILFAAAAALLIFTVARVKAIKKQIKHLSILPILPGIGMITNNQFVFLCIAAVVFLAALITCIVSIVKQNNKLKAAKEAKKPTKAKPAPAQNKPAPVEEKAPVVEEPVVEEPVVEEPVVEEPVVEEPVVEEPVVEEPVVEEPVVEEPVVDEPVAPEAPVVAPVANSDSDSLVITETDASGNVVYSTYKKSFTARMIQAPTDIQERYEAIKNALLSYKKVSARTSFGYESFKTGHTPLAKFAIRGKTLCLFLALNPASFEESKYNLTDVSSSKKYETVPCRLRLTSKRSVKWGLELIEALAEKHALVANPKYETQKFIMEYESTEALIEKGLIKKI